MSRSVLVSLFLSETLCCLSFFPFMIWFVLCLPHHTPIPLTFDPSDFETSVDSRCTTDSADSAFFGRRYWFPASTFSPFLSSNHPLPSPPTQEVRFQINQQDNKDTDLSFFLYSFLTCCLVVVRLINSCHLSAPISTNWPLNCVFDHICCILWVCITPQICFIYIFNLQTPHLCLCVLVAYV